MTTNGKTVVFDMDLYQVLAHPKIEFIHSDCLTADIPKVGAKTMVILDCNHSAKHVYAELEKYSSMVTLGQYIIVEDTDTSDKSNGPTTAIEKFLTKNKNFIVDKGREKYEISSNLGGYLLRVS